MYKKSLFIKICGIALMIGLNAAAAMSQSSLPTDSTKNSDYAINYDDWNLILSGAVLDTGPSDRRIASRNGARGTSSRIKHGNLSPTAFEGNRVLFYEFNEDHVESLLAIRRDLEAVSDFVPLENFSRNEQLAYWFKLHNVAVMYEVAKEYPIKKIKRLAVGRRSVWDDKTMSIGGIATSISDIEQHVVNNWNTPLVLYGFFMGAVGGPNIRTEAFTSTNIVAGLQENAIEFVNSLRGFRLWSGRGRVSDHYKLGERYFPNFVADIKDHLLAFARPDTLLDLEKAKSFQIKNYDWGIADLKNGDTYNGSSFNTNPGALAYFIEAVATPTGPSAPGLGVTLPNSTVDVAAVSNPEFNAGSNGKISPQTRALLRAVKIRRERMYRSGTVTVEEFVGGDGARVSLKSDKDDEVN
ncbi:DUF547 domain-containing protein [Kordiimonas aquimaris]|uniref:DUF547 domain-containing protein n=1 Tax=Kordiimonas aquimaris TaxID=707591 RepID=UPI0021CEAB6B|nr:DUF547 domain-containing protein [Kordiimonas aquimaris]